MSSYASPTPSSLFDRVHGTPSSASSYNLNAPPLASVPLPHGQGQVPVLHYLLGNSSPNYLKFNVAFPLGCAALSPALNSNALSEPAMNPLTTVLRLRIPAVNLIFDVINPRGVLVSDVFHTIFRYLQQALSRDAYGSLPPSLREATDMAFQRRLQKASSRQIQGINERLAFVDCLGEKSHFYSLSYMPEGVWDVILV